MMPSKGKGGALSGLADRRILRSAAGRSVQRTPGRAFPQEGPGRSVSADRRCARVTPPDAEASARRGAVFRHRPSTDYRVKRETRMLRKKSEGLPSPGMPEREARSADARRIGFCGRGAGRVEWRNKPGCQHGTGIFGQRRESWGASEGSETAGNSGNGG